MIEIVSRMTYPQILKHFLRYQFYDGMLHAIIILYSICKQIRIKRY
jgi:hypothetical protein